MKTYMERVRQGFRQVLVIASFLVLAIAPAKVMAGIENSQVEQSQTQVAVAPDQSASSPLDPSTSQSESTKADAEPQQDPGVVEDSAPIPAMVTAISEKYKQPEKLIADIVKFAIKYSRPNFPTADDILAIITVESQFYPKARNRNSKGLMQINMPDHHKRISDPYNVEENIKLGAAILSEYFEFFKGNKRAAIIAYNCGPGNYLKGRGISRYFYLYLKAKKWISNQPTDINLV